MDLRKAGGAQSQPIAAQVSIWTDGRVLPSGKFCIHILYIPVARMRAGMYYRLLTHPSAILVGFWARSHGVIWGAAFAALVDPARCSAQCVVFSGEKLRVGPK